MKRYKAITAAKDPESGQLIYSGKTYGIRFDQGIAWFDDMTVDPKIGKTAAEIARHMRNDFGYHIEVYGPDGKLFDDQTLNNVQAPADPPEMAILNATPKAAAKRATPH